MNKKGVSAVIATVLLIMITVVAAGVIFSFVIPFVNQQTEEASDCFEVFGGLEFANTGYNCYVDTSTDYAENVCGANGASQCYNKTGFSVSITKEGVIGLKVSLISEGSSDIFDIVGGSTFASLEMLDGTLTLEIPQSGGIRTYVVDGIYESGKISAVLENGKACEAADSIIFRKCIRDQAEDVGD